MKTFEVNFDGIVGPTHHYGGLSLGNIASQAHRLKKSYPRQAALEGLKKMKLLADMGVLQAVLPPHERPDILFLKQQICEQNHAEVIQQAAKSQPDLLSIAYSASAMWAANAATVSPSADTSDGRVHFTPANLISTMHRRLEPAFTTKIFRTIFSDKEHFQVHDPLPDEVNFADEGAANHLRLCNEHSGPGVEVFVYGRDGTVMLPRKFHARQTLVACKQIAIQHGLSQEKTLFLQQNPNAIDAGMFHNDVIAVANQNVLVCHQLAYVDQSHMMQLLRTKFPALFLIEITTEELSMPEAVQTYLFNSQLITLPDKSVLLLCPTECEKHLRTRKVVDLIVNKIEAITEARFIDVRQSMQNGGGPACLRLRVVLTENELAAIYQPVLLTEKLYHNLVDWVNRHYREELTTEALGDPNLLTEVRDALEELTRVLKFGPVYQFQQ